jgi:peptidyl-tRNA hydrolase
MKMYILIRESVPLGLALTAAAHAALAAYLKFRDDPAVAEWLAEPFAKVVCKVSDEEFEAAKAHPDRVVLTESALGGAEVALAFKPRAEWPKAFRFYRLYR